MKITLGTRRFQRAVSARGALIGIKCAQIGFKRSELPKKLQSTPARWKRCVPRLAPINALIAKFFYLRSLPLYT
jgi:hypothetical protein